MVFKEPSTYRKTMDKPPEKEKGESMVATERVKYRCSPASIEERAEKLGRYGWGGPKPVWKGPSLRASARKDARSRFMTT